MQGLTEQLRASQQELAQVRENEVQASESETRARESEVRARASEVRATERLRKQALELTQTMQSLAVKCLYNISSHTLLYTL